MPLQPNYSEEELKAHYACLAELNALWMQDKDVVGLAVAQANDQWRRARAARSGKLLAGMPETPVVENAEARLRAFYGVKDEPGDLIVKQSGDDFSYGIVRKPLEIRTGGPGASTPTPITLGPITTYCAHCGLEKGHTWVCPVHPQRAAARAHGLRKAAAPKLPNYDAILAARRAERERDNSCGELPPPEIFQAVTSTQAALERALSFDQHDRDFAVKARLGQR